MDKKLHIVSFDIPWPANYGGIIDVYNKVRVLHALGVQVNLHCFWYGDRQKAVELESICQNVFYYKRTTGVQGLSLLRPYIVNSRKNASLLKNLLIDDAPILFEGLHCCYFLNHPSLKNRNKYVRTHNIEHDYYQGLAQVEQRWFKKMYYRFEAYMLKNYEVVLKEADALFCISDKDTAHFSQYAKSNEVPAFHDNDIVHCKTGEGTYCFYHGNLSVAENNDAAIKLLENVFSKIEHKTIIAGADPSDELIEIVSDCEQVELNVNPTEEEMQQLKELAHIHVLYSGQSTGVKLKLMDSLSQGRFVIGNENILNDDKFLKVARRADNWQEYISTINDLFYEVFQSSDVQDRQDFMISEYSNAKGAGMIIESIFS